MEQNKFKLKVAAWVNGVYVIITKFFTSLGDAIKESKLWQGLVKVYNYIGQLLHCNSQDCECYA